MRDVTAASDRELMLRLARDELACLEVLFRRWQDEAFAFCARTAGREDAEDLVQEGFLRLLRYRGTYRGDAFKPWLLRILRNVCLDRLRQSGKERAVASRWADEAARRRPATQDDARVDRLERALAAMTREEREVIVLARWHDMPYERIAEVLECTPGAARVRMHRALASLRDTYLQLEREEHGLPERA